MIEQVYVLEIFEEGLNDWMVESVFKCYESAKEFAEKKYKEDDYCIGIFDLRY